MTMRQPASASGAIFNPDEHMRVIGKGPQRSAKIRRVSLPKFAVALVALLATAVPAVAQNFFPAPRRVQIVQVSTGMALYGYEFPDYVVRTLPVGGQTWAWLLRPAGGGLYRIQQVSTGRFLDAHEIEAMDYQVVTRPFQSSDNTQLWRLVQHGDSYTIQQASNMRFLGAYDYGGHQAVTRPEQLNPTTRWNQRWKIIYLR